MARIQPWSPQVFITGLALIALAACGDGEVQNPIQPELRTPGEYDPSLVRAELNPSFPASPRISKSASAAGGVVDIVLNGGFETNGGAGTTMPAGWTEVNAGNGSWYVDSGTTSPVSGFSVPAPPEGSFVAMTDQNGPGMHILYQDVTIPALGGALSFELFIGNRHGTFHPLNTLSHTSRPNQQFRMDIVDPSAPTADMGAGVLMNIYRTEVGDPAISGYTTVSASLDDFAGQTVRLRFASTQTEYFLQVGIDDVQVLAVIDDTPPVVTPSISGTLGDNGWYTSDVDVSFEVEDTESGIATQEGCGAASVIEDTSEIDFTCSASNGAGLSAEATATVKRDATAPTVSFAGGQATYTVSETVAIVCSSDDNLSGVASDTCADVSGAAHTFALGTNSFTAEATDNAGNVGNGSVSFDVIVTYDSLCELTKSFVANNGIANAMCSKLDAAAAAAARGQTSAMQGALGAYKNHVQAQSGKSLTSAQAEILIQLAGAL